MELNARGPRKGVMIVTRTGGRYQVKLASRGIKLMFHKLGMTPEAALNRSTVFNNEGIWPVVLSLVTGEEQMAKGVELKGQCSIKFNVWCVPFKYKTNRFAIVVLEESFSDASKMHTTHTRDMAVEIAASAVHEIRNPITAIRGFLQLLKEDKESVSREDVDNVLSELDRMEAIMTDVLILSTPSRCREEPLDLNQLLESYCSNPRFTNLSKTIRLIRCYQNDLPPVYADPRQMRQVFDNLIKNAFEAIGDGPGCVTVETASLDNDGLVSITIKDTGCGISQDSMMYIFRPFNSTKLNGTGLGLSVVLKIIDDHEGFLEVESEPGKGSTFTVYLPSAQSTGGHKNKRQC
ncbi:MAG TPA: hypothetical protein GXX40_07650 [Firmicutes bacterium]|nr:hypothetical protein [Bacillota bacterium]